MFHRIVYVFACMVLFVLMASASFAADLDQKTYPGAFCQQGGTSQALWYYHGRVINTSTSPRVADCPIVTDAWWGLYKGKVEVNVVDRHYSQDFSCTVHVYDERSPSLNYFWRNIRSSGSGETVQKLAIDFSNSPIGGWGFAPMMIGCQIPGAYNGNRSDLISYHAWELEGDLSGWKSSD
jgi:hypothetical protein